MCPRKLPIPLAHAFRGEVFSFLLFCFLSAHHRKFLGPEGLSYSLFPAYSRAYAFTVSKASAVFVNRRDEKSASMRRKNASRSASSRNSIITPRSLSGVFVGVARNSLTPNPRSPGNVFHPGE